MRRANWISLCMIVTRFAWMAHKFVSSNRCTKYASSASCSAKIAFSCHRIPYDVPIYSTATSLTSRAKGSFRISKLSRRWYCLISWRARGTYFLLLLLVTVFLDWVAWSAPSRRGVAALRGMKRSETTPVMRTLPQLGRWKQKKPNLIRVLPPLVSKRNWFLPPHVLTFLIGVHSKGCARTNFALPFNCHNSPAFCSSFLQLSTCLLVTLSLNFLIL